MILQCTKKLLDYFGIRAEKPAEDIEPLFEWGANLILINRRKTLVVTHLASQSLFVIHGITAKQLPRIPALIRDGIRALLESEHVRSDVIRKYLADCGDTVRFMANRTRSAAAVCNKACERVSMFKDYFEQNNMFQQELLPAINDDLVLKADGKYTFQILTNQLTERYGEKVLAHRAVELEVSLHLSTPCTRTLTVPEDMNFYQLHQVLQEAFGWEDCHVHQFIIETDWRGHPTKIILPQWDEWETEGVECIESSSVTVGQIFATKREIIYEYDFGDGWEHTIRFKRFISDCTHPYPQCTHMEGTAPTENCGGPLGFDQLREILNDPNHPEYKEMCGWLDSGRLKTTDLKYINARLRDADRCWKKSYMDMTEN
ncbi:MAG: plasmid pRiA4b ORF-3 family protein [Clostridia bacterium]|nr:plasmid pRiA4b ORF-3 family protein [Clostridia bacterium]